MSIQPLNDSNVVLEGIFRFSAKYHKAPTITDEYRLRIAVSGKFPFDLPKVTELDKKIPRDRKHHVNEADDTLCLGSPLRLARAVTKEPTLTGFASLCLVPFLYAMSHKRLLGGELLFSELKHGIPGILDDYADLFRLTDREAAESALVLLGMKKRKANKRLCPCGCRGRVGKCKFNYTLREWRKIAGRPWFRQQLADIRKDPTRLTASAMS